MVLAAGEKAISSMACNPVTKTIALGTELTHHEASILLWYTLRVMSLYVLR